MTFVSETTWSPSKLETAAKCLAAYLFSYVERLPFATRSAMQYGKAVDDMANGVYTEKLKTARTPSASDARDRFAAAWDWYGRDVDEWKDGDTRASLLDDGARTVPVWRDRIADAVFPASVQRRVEATVVDDPDADPMRFRGIIDLECEHPASDIRVADPTRSPFANRIALVESEDTVRVISDTKTAGRSYDVSAFARRFQPVAYTLMVGVPTFEYHVLVATKIPKVQILRATITDDERRGFITRAGMIRRQVERAHQTGDWLPNRTHMLCSRRWCDHWASCEKRFGGRVPE